MLASTANGNWGQWSGWASCLADCGDGLQYRERQCDSPTPANSGKNCLVVDGIGALEARECNNGPCTGGEWQSVPTTRPVSLSIDNETCLYHCYVLTGKTLKCYALCSNYESES